MLKRLFVLILAITAGAVTAPAQTFSPTLSGNRVVGATGSLNGHGIAVLSFDGAVVRYYLWVRDIGAPTAARVHLGRTGSNGATVLDLAPSFTSPVAGVYVSAGLLNIDPATAQAIAAGPMGYYVDVNTQSLSGGALRGQLLGDDRSESAFSSTLLGSRVVGTAGDPDGLGHASAIVDGGKIYFFLWVKSVTTPTGARIYYGQAGKNGPMVANCGGAFAGGISIGVVDIDTASVAAAVTHSEDFYFQVATTEFPQGALRGQFHPTESVFYYPVLARNAGAGTSNYKSDMRILNLSDLDATVFFEWYAKGAAGAAGPAKISQQVVAARSNGVFDDVIGALFSANDRGAVRVLSTSDLRCVAQTYNDQRPTGGTFGQFIAGVSLETALQSGVLVLNSNRPKSDGVDFRTNLGYFNPNPTPVEIVFNVRKPDGSLIGTPELKILAPYANELALYNKIIPGIPTGAENQPVFYVTFSANAPVFVYSSVVDNKTDDGLHQPAVPVPASVTLKPEINHPPKGVITSPVGDKTVTLGYALAVSGTVSDPDGDLITVLWDFGDGVTSTALAPADHTYATAGNYTLTFTIKDSKGLVDPNPPSRKITVRDLSGVTLSMIQDAIFTPKCVACHPPNRDLDLTAGKTFGEIVEIASIEQPYFMRVKKGDWENSYLFHKLAGSAGISGARMPLAGPYLSEDDLELVRAWIVAGAKND